MSMEPDLFSSTYQKVVIQAQMQIPTKERVMPLNSNPKEINQAKKRPTTLAHQKTKNFLLLIGLIAASLFSTTGKIFGSNQNSATTATTTAAKQSNVAISANFRKAKNITDNIATRVIFKKQILMSMRSMAR